MSQALPLFSNEGRCPFCEATVRFNAWGTNLRDSYVCSRCGTVPRERALMVAMERFFPNWRELHIHESSPGTRGASKKMLEQCRNYTATQYHPSVVEGAMHPDGWRCENLERQTFGDAAFDLVVTQDVLEHVFDPDAVFREVARTLRPGGAHVATTPMVRGREPTIICAERLTDGQIRHHHKPDYHQNPVDGNGSLVTVWWGYDIARRIDDAAPMSTMIWSERDVSLGIDGPLNEVIVSFLRPHNGSQH